MIRTLTPADFGAVHRAFVEAFSDYVVPLAPPPDRLLEMLTRRGWVASASSFAIENDRIVAFTLNGIEGDRAYDSGTGVVPSHRGRGLGRQMMEASFELLRAHGCRDYTLEVIDSNTTAANLYRSLGFEELRGLQCWTHDVIGEPASSAVSQPAPPNGFEDWWDVEPSWQNSSASLARATDETIIVGDDDAYAIVQPITGDLAQLAVRPAARRKKLGVRLLREARMLAGKPLRIINVDERSASISAFLEHCGAKRTFRQLEMRRRL